MCGPVQDEVRQALTLQLLAKSNTSLTNAHDLEEPEVRTSPERKGKRWKIEVGERWQDKVGGRLADRTGGCGMWPDTTGGHLGSKSSKPHSVMRSAHSSLKP